MRLKNNMKNLRINYINPFVLKKNLLKKILNQNVNVI